MQPIDLENKIALVTGASRGIGKAIAISLARAGASVAIHHRQNDGAAALTAIECGRKSFVLKGDVANSEHCHSIVQSVVDYYGRLDIVINNAAMGKKDSVEMHYEDWLTHWQRTLDTNLLSAVNISYCAIRQMQKQRGGKIINIASRSAFRGETEYFAYAVSKAGMINLTRCFARAFAKDGIRVYAIAPGFIEAGMGLEGIAEYGKEIRAQIPSGKIGSADDVASVVLFLASDLSNYCTGSTIDVNGGSYLH